MKYDILSGYRQYLQQIIPNRNTADRYYFAVDQLLRDYQFSSLGEISRERLEHGLEQIHGKNNFSATKMGLKHLYNFDTSLNLPTESFFKEQNIRKRNHSVRAAKTLYLDTIRKKTNAIRDERVKLAYRLMLVSGLRVGEVSQLTRDDLSFGEDGCIIVRVRFGKGGSNGEIVCMPDLYLSDRLRAYLANKAFGQRLFLAQSTLRQKAHQLQLECHDFRRIAAITYRQNQMGDANISRFAANEKTKFFLRHRRFSTTKRYLFNRKLRFKLTEQKSGIEKIDE